MPRGSKKMNTIFIDTFEQLFCRDLVFMRNIDEIFEIFLRMYILTYNVPRAEEVLQEWVFEDQYNVKNQRWKEGVDIAGAGNAIQESKIAISILSGIQKHIEEHYPTHIHKTYWGSKNTKDVKNFNGLQDEQQETLLLLQYLVPHYISKHAFYKAFGCDIRDKLFSKEQRNKHQAYRRYAERWIEYKDIFKRIEGPKKEAVFNYQVIRCYQEGWKKHALHVMRDILIESLNNVQTGFLNITPEYDPVTLAYNKIRKVIQALQGYRVTQRIAQEYLHNNGFGEDERYIVLLNTSLFLRISIIKESETRATHEEIQEELLAEIIQGDIDESWQKLELIALQFEDIVNPIVYQKLRISKEEQQRSRLLLEKESNFEEREKIIQGMPSLFQKKVRNQDVCSEYERIIFLKKVHEFSQFLPIVLELNPNNDYQKKVEVAMFEINDTGYFRTRWKGQSVGGGRTCISRLRKALISKKWPSNSGMYNVDILEINGALMELEELLKTTEVESIGLIWGNIVQEICKRYPQYSQQIQQVRQPAIARTKSQFP